MKAKNFVIGLRWPSDGAWFSFMNILVAELNFMNVGSEALNVVREPSLPVQGVF